MHIILSIHNKKLRGSTFDNICPQTPWGTHRTKPAQGRATFKPLVLRWRCGGGLYCPSPSPPGFPRSKANRLGLLSPLRYAPFRSQTLHQRLKGGGAAPGRSRGPSGRKKRKRPCLRFFLFKGGVLPPPPPHRHSGAY
jgi:hypothetical protein